MIVRGQSRRRTSPNERVPPIRLPLASRLYVNVPARLRRAADGVRRRNHWYHVPIGASGCDAEIALGSRLPLAV